MHYPALGMVKKQMPFKEEGTQVSQAQQKREKGLSSSLGRRSGAPIAKSQLQDSHCP